MWIWGRHQHDQGHEQDIDQVDKRLTGERAQIYTFRRSYRSQIDRHADEQQAEKCGRSSGHREVEVVPRLNGCREVRRCHEGQLTPTGPKPRPPKPCCVHREHHWAKGTGELAECVLLLHANADMGSPDVNSVQRRLQVAGIGRSDAARQGRFSLGGAVGAHMSGA